jgi:hypothetical protein
MKKLIIIAIAAISLTSCTENQRARSFGGTEVINLEAGTRLVNVTWKGKDASLWILTKKDTTKATTYYFNEKSGFGVLEGQVIINEK